MKIRTDSRTQVIATIGPSSKDEATFKRMYEAGMDAIRLNLSWGKLDEHLRFIYMACATDMSMPIIADLPGPRIQGENGHTFDNNAVTPTEKDKELMAFAVQNKLKYIALSYVKNASEIEESRKHVESLGGNCKFIAKIERPEALENIESILKAADAIMVARGDLSKNIPLEKLPATERELIRLAKEAKKPVIVATGMLTSMLEHTTPTQAEITDISYAVNLGTDAVLLTDETAAGKHPVECVQVMERIILETEKTSNFPLHLL